MGEQTKTRPMREIIERYFETALSDAKIPPRNKETIGSGPRLKKLYAKASDWGWSDRELDLLCKEELGYQSKRDIHPGKAYDEILQALESNELLVQIGRDPDTRDAFPNRPSSDMPDIIEAEVRYPANDWMDGKYGPYTDAVFTSPDVPDDEVKVYMNKDDELSDALFNLKKGETYQLLYKGDGKAELQDSDLKDLLNGGSPTGSSSGGSSNGSSSGGDLPSWEEVERKARFIGSAYVHLEQRFRDAKEKGKIDRLPETEAVQKMAVTAVIS